MTPVTHDLPALPPGPLTVEVDGLAKGYAGAGAGKISVPVFEGLSLAVAAGEKVAIVGDSGVGKSTLLHLLGALDTPTAGTIKLGGLGLEGLSVADRATLRRLHLGFVFQFHHLLGEFTARENISMPAVIDGHWDASAARRADALLERLGLSARAAHLPGQLSGGEQQRCAIARSLLMQPGLVLADEPTGNLDPRLGAEVFDLLLELAAEKTFTLVVVTHNEGLARRCDRVLKMTRNGLSAI